jgi:hypothetical protein
MADKSSFTIVFFSAVALTAFCGLATGALALFGPNPQPPPIAALFDTLKFGFSAGLLAIFGLLGSRPIAKRTSRIGSRPR